VKHRVAREATRREAIRALQRQNRLLWNLMERCDKDDALLKARLAEEHEANARRIEGIEMMDAGSAAWTNDLPGLPRVRQTVDEEEVPADWRTRVNGVLGEMDDLFGGEA